MPTIHCRIAETRTEIDAALRLRYQVFAAELGYLDPAHRFVPREVDPFDTLETTIHILAYRDETPVGALRILRASNEVARTNGTIFGLDIESKFNLTPFAESSARLAETTRYCVLAEHRGSTVASALHSAAIDVSRTCGVTHWIACANTEKSSLADAFVVQRAAADLGLQHDAIWITPIAMAGERSAPFAVPRRAEAAARPALPRTLELYAFRMGARFVGPPIYDARFRMCSIPMLMVVDEQRARSMHRQDGPPRRRQAA